MIKITNLHLALCHTAVDTASCFKVRYFRVGKYVKNMYPFDYYFHRYRKFAWVTLGLVLVSSWATTIYISVKHQYKARIQEPFEMFDDLYEKPWSRIGPYLVGKMVIEILTLL